MQPVSTTTGAGELFAQLTINVVIRHTLNSFLHITGLSGHFCLSLCCCDRCCGVLFGALPFGFGFRFVGAARVTETKSACNCGQHSNSQADNHFKSHMTSHQGGFCFGVTFTAVFNAVLPTVDDLRDAFHITRIQEATAQREVPCCRTGRMSLLR
ncbi:Uncharacterised protein [Citrobacter koseri]|nr:Uncharacterised protein [Citrobacter koseri]